MESRCPICRAKLQEESAICRRCGADLGLVLGARALGEELIRGALLSLARGDRQRAVALAQRAGIVHAAPFTRSLVGFLLAKVD